MFVIDEKEGDLLFAIFVQPKSSKNMVSGVHGDALKVKITAPPVDGAANAMCVKFFSKLFGVPRSSIEIVSGQTGRNKRIRVRLGGTPGGDAKLNEIRALLISFM